MPALGRLLERLQGITWGDGVRDTTVYVEDHGLWIDALGRDAGKAALLVRGIDARNAPTELFRINKDGASVYTGNLTVPGDLAVGGNASVAGNLAVTGGLTASGLDVVDAVTTARANLLVNPGVEVWQRGAGPFTASNAFAADRWYLVLQGSSTLSVSRDAANADAGSQYCAACTYVHNTESYLYQKLEDYPQLRGRTLTLAARVRTAVAGAARLSLFDSVNGRRYSAYHSGGGAYETLTVTAPIAAAATAIQLELVLDASATVYLDNAVCAVGTTAPSYVPLHPADDLARCQRYYYELGGLATNQFAGAGFCSSTTVAWVFVLHPVQLALAPTLSISAAGDWSVYNAGASPVTATAVATAAGYNTARTTRLDVTVASGLTTGGATLLFALNANARIRFEASP